MPESSPGSPLPGAVGSGRGEVLTVAQLVARQSAGARDAATVHTPVARETVVPAPTAHLVSVGSLLRREGRAPHAVDRPMRPRAVRQSELAAAWPARPTSGRRRATAVAGGLVAAGSVLGAALYNGAATHDSDAGAAADGLFPGLSLPGGAATPATLPPDYLPTTIALTGPMTPSVLQAATTDWMRIAFPDDAAAADSAATAVLSSAATMPPGPGTVVPAAGNAVQNTPAPSSGGAGGGGGSGGGGLLPMPGNPGRPAETNLLDPLTGGGGGSSGGPGTRSAPRAGTGPLQDVTEAARPVGDAAGGAVAPVARTAAPVGRIAGGVLAPVAATATPLTTALAPVTKPVNDALEPVTTPVLGALSPVTEPVLKAADPLTGPVLQAAQPVTGLLDTSAAPGEETTSSTATGRHRGVADGGSATTPVSDLLGGTASSVTDTAGGLIGGLTGGGE